MSAGSRHSRFARILGSLILLVGSGVALGLPLPATAAGPVTVSLTFNDGLSSQFRNARPVLRTHGVKGTFYVASRFVRSDDAKYMRFYELDSLYREGDEIGGMGMDHEDLTATYSSDPATDVAHKTDQVCGDRSQLAGLGYDPYSFTYPGGAVNAAAESIVSGCGYTSGRLVGGLGGGSGPSAEPIPPVDPFVLRGANLSSGPVSANDLKDAVNAAATDGGGWVPFVFDDVCSASAPDYATCMAGYRPIDSAVLSDFLDWIKSGSPAGTTVRTVRDVMGAPTPPPLPPRPTSVSLTFDDGLRSQYNLRSVLNARAAKATFYINSGAVDATEASVMTWPQIHTLETEGQEIGGHTKNHVDLTATDTTFDQKWHQTCDDRARLVEQGFNPSAFAYPFAAFNPTAETIVRGCGFQSARTGGSIGPTGPRYAGAVPPADPYAYAALGTTYNGPITLQSMQDAVNGASMHGGGWVPMIFHDVCLPTRTDFDTCMAGYRPVSSVVIRDFLTWLSGQASAGVSLRTVSDVMNNGAVPPPVAVTSPVAGGTVGDTTPSITGSASATGGDVTVSVFDGSYSVGTPLATFSATPSAGAWSAAVPNELPFGTYTVQASQQRNGVTGTSPPVTFIVGLDTTPPVLSFTSPAANASLRATSVNVAGTAGTQVDDLRQVAVELHTATDPTGPALAQQTLAVAATGAWSGTFSGLAEGSYVLTAAQTDRAGNVGQATPRTFVLDTTAPSVTIGAPFEGATVGGTAVTASGTAGVSPGDAATVTVSAYAGSGTTGTTAGRATGTITSGGAWSARVTGLAAGDYTLVARQVDSAGNSGASSPVHVTLAGAMAVTSVSPATVAQGTSGQVVTVTGTRIPADATATVSGSGVSVTAREVVSATTMNLTLSVSTTATVGTRNVVLSAPGQANATCTACLTVTVVPRVTSASPNQLGQGAAAATVLLTGTGFNASTQAVIGGSGVTTTIASRTSTSLSLRVTVALDATVGPRDLTVTDASSSTTTCAGCFTVLDAPRVTSVTPSSVRRGTTVIVTVNGTSFEPSVRLTVSGTGVTIVTVTYVDPATLQVSVRTTATAALGPRSLTVTSNTTKGATTAVNALTVVT